MKTKRRSAAPNQLVTRYGTARFYQARRAKSLWQNPNVPELKPFWLVRFHVGGETWEESAGPLYPVADGLAAVKIWAETRMRTRLDALRAGRLEQMEAVVRPAQTITLAKLRKVYLNNVPPNKPDYKKNAARLLAILTEATGLKEEDIEMTDEMITRELLLGWVRLRQEHARKGWTVDGKAPDDAWEKLRTQLKEGKLPGVDKQTVMQCNTTIKTYLRCAKAVFANEREYLVGLPLPPLEALMKFSVDLAAPEGHREIPTEILTKLWADAPRLAREEPKVWAFNRIVSWTGARPITVRQLNGAALTVLEDGTGELALPSAKGGKAVRVAIDAMTVQALKAVRTDESLLGAKHKTEAEQIYRSHNDWLTKHGMDGTQKTYLLRHMRLQQYREVGGVELAAAGGGHTTTAMVERKYTQGAKIIPMVSPETGRKVKPSRAKRRV